MGFSPVAFLCCYARSGQRKLSQFNAMAHPARTTILIVWLLASCRESAGSEVGAALAVGFGLLCAVCCHQGCALISQGNGALVERFGRLDRQLGPGFHLKLPFVERISAHLSTRERILDVSLVHANSLREICVLQVPAQRCITSDNAPLMADAVIFYRIRDLTKAVYAIDDFRVGLQDVILTQCVRHVCATHIAEQNQLGCGRRLVK